MQAFGVSRSLGLIRTLTCPTAVWAGYLYIEKNWMGWMGWMGRSSIEQDQHQISRQTQYKGSISELLLSLAPRVRPVLIWVYTTFFEG